MNPLDTISGPAKILPLPLSVDNTTIINPFSERSLLSRRTIFPTSPTPKPSTKIFPDVTVPFFTIDLDVSSITSPLFPITVFSMGIPNSFAKFTC